MFPDIQRASDFLGPNPLPLNGQCLLAEGDSWFTIGRLMPSTAPNLLSRLHMVGTTTIINCAYPGDTLHHIADSLEDNDFNRLLCQPGWQLRWHGILLSGGGNDLIDAAQAPPLAANGAPAPLTSRVLLTPAEAQALKPGDNSPARFVSEPGWLVLAQYLVRNVREIARRRDLGVNQGRPIIMHTYSVPTVWRCGVVTAPDGWLFKAFQTYGIPPAERQGVAAELFARLRGLLRGFASGSGLPQALPAFHVFDSAAQVKLVPPDPAASGSSGDWANEIHPNSAGYTRLGQAFGPFIEQVLGQYP